MSGRANVWTVLAKGALVCFIWGVFATVALSQAGTADIVGTVTDSTGAVLPGATVTAKDTATGLARTQTTGASGDYSFTLVPIGTYEISVEVTGFKKFTAAQVTIATGDRARVDAPMQVGAVTQTVEVQGEVAAALQTDSATVGSLITTQATQDLPLNGRNIIQLAQLTPGASEGPSNALTNGTRPDDRRQTSTIVANGQNFDTNNFVLDGMDNNERMVQTIVVKPSVDAIQEVKTQTNLYTAESGRAGGAVVNMITRSGSNGVHGDAFEFLRNDVFDAKSFFLPNQKPEFRQNNFGGSLGGAIKKDKIFVFGGYEALRIIQGQVNPTGSGILPTACELGQAACNGITQLGNFSDLIPAGTNCQTTPAAGCIYDPATTAAQYAANAIPGSPNTNVQKGMANWFPNNVIPLNRLDSISRAYASLIEPDAGYETQAGQQCGAAGWLSSPANARGGCIVRLALNKAQYFNTGDLRFDEHLSDKDILYERYIINNENGTFPGALPPVKVGSTLVYPGSTNGNAGTTSFPGTSQERAQSVSISETHIIRPTLLLQMNLQGSRYASISNPPDASIPVNATVLPGPFGVSASACGLGCDGLAPFSFGGTYSLIGDAFALPTDYFDTDYQITSALTWTKGSHTTKFGGSIIRRYFNVYNSITKGNFTFNGTQSDANATVTNPGNLGGNPFASMLLGDAASIAQSYQLVPQEYRTNEYGFFAQDDWRATRNLTINLGVRWDYFSPLTDKHNSLADFDPLNPGILSVGRTIVAGQNGVSRTDNFDPQLRDFQPRVGFAYTAAHSFVVRGGFGTTNYPDNTAGPSLLRDYPLGYSYSNSQPPVIQYPVTTVNVDTPLPPSQVFSTCVAAVCGETASAYSLTRGFLSAGGTVTQNWHWPTVYQYNFIVEKAFAGNVLSVGYLGENGRGVAGGINFDAPLPPNGPGGVSGLVGYAVTASGANSTPCMTYNYAKAAAGLAALALSPVAPSNTPNSCQPFFNQLPLVTSTSMYTPYGHSNYNSLQVQFQRRFLNGLTFSANYVYAQALSNVGTGGGNCTSCAQVWNNLSRDYGISDLDVRHRIAATANYQIPFGRSLSGISGQAIKGWQVNVIAVHSTGTPFTVTDSEGLMGNGATGYRLNQLPQQSFTKSLNEWFNTNDFQQQPFGTVSTLGIRNAYFGPSFTHLDFSLFKDFSLTERFKLQFRYEVFNIFNTPYFSVPNAAISSWAATPDTATGTCNGNGGPTPCPVGGVANQAVGYPTSTHLSGSFGSITTTNPNYTPRDMQFALKLSF
jgi:hypothetical protein